MKYVVVAETNSELLAERSAHTLAEARRVAKKLRADCEASKGVTVTIGRTDGDAVESWSNDSGRWERVS